MVGPLTGFDRLLVAAGGENTGLGIAHPIGDAVAAMIRSQTTRYPLPAEFAPERHFTRPSGGKGVSASGPDQV